ncbi:MAG TPA: helix-turn-helix domain-containing protein [Dongiaceae bacterium]|nr:helix-turn-helix domain-containing protein [Dongiaceae bacterium]
MMESGDAILQPDPDGHVSLSVLLIPGFALGDLARVVDTLTTANEMAGRQVFQIQTIGLVSGAVPSASSIDVNPDRCIADGAAGSNILILAETSTADILPEGSAALTSLVDWLQAADTAGSHIGAVANGAVLLARLGLMQGYACATPGQAAMMEDRKPAAGDLFCRQRGPASLHPDLFVIDRRRFTCAGGCATSDLMLRVVRQTLGEDAARHVTGQLLRDRARDAGELQPHAHLASSLTSAGALQRALQAMRRHAEQPLELRAIAKRAGVHLRHLERLFRRHLGTSPREFYLRLRLQRARELMQGTTTTLSAIARDVGFDSLSHFSKCYTEAYGTRPSEDRQRLFTSAANGPKSVSRGRRSPAKPAGDLAVN